MDADEIWLKNNKAESRFEFDLEGQTGLIDYREEDGLVYLVHTEVPESLGGQGFGTEMVRQALEEIRKHDAKVVPRCSFVAAYINKNPEWKKIVAS